MPSMSHEDFLITVREKVMDGGVVLSAASRETSLYFIHEVTFTDIIYQYTHEKHTKDRGDFAKIPLGTPSDKSGHDWMVE